MADPAETAIREAYEGLAPSAEVKDDVLAGIGDTARTGPPKRGRLLLPAGLAAAAAVLAVFLLVPRPDPGGPAPEPQPELSASAIEAARAANLKAYHLMEDQLREKHQGRYAVFAGGMIVGLSDDLDELLELGEGEPHRFVFRVGDEGDVKGDGFFWYGPRFAGGQVVEAIGADVMWWSSNVRVSRGEERGKLAPGGEEAHQVLFRIRVPGGEVREVPVTLNNIGPPLVLTTVDYEEMGLARFEVPGTMTLLGLPFRRVCVRAGIAGITGDTLLVAAVPSVPLEKIVPFRRERNAFWNWGGGLAERITKGREGRWIVVGAERVLGEGGTAEEALRRADDSGVFDYQRWLVRLPLPPDSALKSRLGEMLDPPREYVLNGRQVTGRRTRTGEIVVSVEDARDLGLEKAESLKRFALPGGTGEPVLLSAGYAWEGEGRTRLALVIGLP